jgi:Tfp pilus assembly protein PilF
VAENALKRALDMDPQNYEAQFLLARVYHKTDRPDLARATMAEAERLRNAAESRKAPIQ